MLLNVWIYNFVDFHCFLLDFHPIVQFPSWVYEFSTVCMWTRCFKGPMRLYRFLSMCSQKNKRILVCLQSWGQVRMCYIIQNQTFHPPIDFWEDGSTSHMVLHLCGSNSHGGKSQKIVLLLLPVAFIHIFQVCSWQELSHTAAWRPPVSRHSHCHSVAILVCWAVFSWWNSS